MKALVLGFTEHRKTATGVLLYGGDDREAANVALDNGAAGIVRTALYQHLQPFKVRNFEAVEGETFPEDPPEDVFTISEELKAAFVEFDLAQSEGVLFPGDQIPASAILAYIEACKAIDQKQWETFDSLTTLAQLVRRLFSERQEFRAENKELHESKEAQRLTFANVVKEVEAERDEVQRKLDEALAKLAAPPTTEPSVVPEKEKEELDLKAAPKSGGPKK